MFCSNCGCKNDDKAVFCKNCGMKLERVDIEKDNNKSEIIIPKKNLLTILVSLILLVIILIVGIYSICKTKDKNNAVKTNNITIDKEGENIDKTLSKAIKAIINKDFSTLYDELYISEDIYYPKEDFVKEWNEYVNNGEMEEDISNGLKKAKDKEPDKHLIKSNVIKINVTDFQEENIKENSKPVKVPINIKLFNAITIKDEIEMLKVKGEWKITLDSIYKLIENQEKIFLGAVAIAIFNFMKLSYL